MLVVQESKVLTVMPAGHCKAAASGAHGVVSTLALLQFCQVDPTGSDQADLLVISEPLHSSPAASVDINTVRQVGDSARRTCYSRQFKGFLCVVIVQLHNRLVKQLRGFVLQRCQHHVAATLGSFLHSAARMCMVAATSPTNSITHNNVLALVLAAQVLLSVAGDGSICLVPGNDFLSASPSRHTFKQASGWSGYSEGRWVDSHTFATVSCAGRPHFMS